MQYSGYFLIYRYIIKSMDIDIIVKECQDGSREAFGFLYQTYSLSMLEVINYYVSNRDVANDILHDGFIVAFTSIGSLKDTAKIQSWLTTIMKNLSLQYLRKQSEHVLIPISETLILDQLEDEIEQPCMTWQELDAIIQKLPEGYENVFRLNVLQGLTHKEIAKLLGISHLTSASQLHRAKGMLRRLIYQYKTEIGVLSIISVAFVVYYLMIQPRNNDGRKSSSKDNTLLSRTTTIDSLRIGSDTINKTGGITKRIPIHRNIDQELSEIESRVQIEKESVSRDTINQGKLNDNRDTDSIIVSTTYPNPEPHIAEINQRKQPLQPIRGDWTFSLVYSSSIGHSVSSMYRIPDIASDIPGQEIEEKRNIRHHMPVVIGLSLGKSISSQWSVASGLRYSYLRTDIFAENKYYRSETIQKAHYIGIPLKFNFTAFQTNKFSVYGQAGFVMNVPVHCSSVKSEYYPNVSVPATSKYNLNMPLQWSAEGGIGIQYHITPTMSIYAEPSINYHFESGSGLNTIMQERQLEFTIPIGIKFTW